MQYQPLSSLQSILNDAINKSPKINLDNGPLPNMSNYNIIPKTTIKPLPGVQQSVSPMGVQAKAPSVAPSPTVAQNSQVKTVAPKSSQPAVASNGFGGLIGNLSNTAMRQNPGAATAQRSLLAQAENPTPATPAIQGLYGRANTPSPEVLRAQEDYARFTQENPYMIAAQHNPNVAADVASGRSSLLGQTFAAEAQAKQAAVNNALAGQQQQIGAQESAGSLGLSAQAQQISAANQAGSLGNTAQSQAITGLGTAAGLVQPTQVSPANSLVSPQTGQQVYEGLGLTGLGIANQNIAQGQKFQQEAAELSKTLAQIDKLAPTVINFLKTSGLNDSRLPYLNQQVNSFIADNQNPAAIRAGLDLYMTELKNFQQQIIAQSGLTPSDAGYQIATLDPSNLHIKDLTAWIENLKNIGQIRLQPLQQAAQKSYGSNTGGGGVNPYSGAAATPSIESAYAPDIQPGTELYNAFNSGNIPKATIGVIGNTINTGTGMVSGLSNWLKSF